MVLPVVGFTKTNVKVGWQEPYTSESINQKFLGLPTGVYLGFTPISPDANTLNLTVDATYGCSVLRTKASATSTSVDIITTSTVALDFSTHTFSAPIYVVASTTYAVGASTTGAITATTTVPNGVTTIGICKCTGKSGSAVLFTALAAPDRHQPLANTGVAFGFMRGGDIQSLDLNSATTTDVNNSKTDTQSVVQATLAARLTADFGGVNLGKTLSRTLEFVKGNAFVAAGVTSKNISGSFAKFDRDVAPAINIAGGGSESADGVITTGTHPLGRNIVYLRDHSGKVPTGVYSGVGIGVYGRVTLATQAMTGTTAFVLAGQGVVGTGTTFTTQCVVGDIIKGGDGNYYEIATITDNTNLTLATAYQSANIAGVTSDRRRFTVTFYTSNAGTETAYTLTSLGMYPYFPVYTSVNIARSGATADGLAGMVPDKLALVDGTTPFTAVQTGVLPTSALHLSTKSYVDGLTRPAAYYSGQLSATVTPAGLGFKAVFGSAVQSAGGVSQNLTTGAFSFTTPGFYCCIGKGHSNTGGFNIRVQQPIAGTAVNGLGEGSASASTFDGIGGSIVQITSSGTTAEMAFDVSQVPGVLLLGNRTWCLVFRVG